MKKEFMNPEMEVLRFQKGVDVLLTSENEINVSSSPANSSKSLSRGIFDNSVD